MDGKGIAAARARIEAAFKQLHHDERSKAQVLEEKRMEREISTEKKAQIITAGDEVVLHFTRRLYTWALISLCAWVARNFSRRCMSHHPF
jgi:hypothetical protein